MRTKAARQVRPFTLLAVLAVVAVGCGNEKAGNHDPEVRSSGSDAGSGTRARAVADAWDGSRAAELWRTGYYPMADAVQLPEGGFHSAADKRAYETQHFVLSGALPATPHDTGQVTWPSGKSVVLPLLSAQKAYTSLGGNSGDGPHLAVTGARLGEMTLVTSRGPATVPAWLFTLEGYDTPLRRVAISPSRLPRPPITPVGRGPSGELWQIGRLAEMSGDGRSVKVKASHGACDDGPVVDVLETEGSVVLSASIVGEKDGPCTSQAILETVTVKLARKLGNRVLLDAFTGRPVPYGPPYGKSPSWS
ncbi:hypothetical protein ABZX90_17335 [Streptomyces sp. NPDC002935]|uniref:hypothetical protein n=1 Tax=Streptomyces sp. NPDC002935 TaxID=3154545 RepID=UPI0033AAC949